MFDEYDSRLPAFSSFGGERASGGLLESALALPRQTFDGRALYPRIHQKAGVLLRSLIKNHPLVDGNKRMAMATTALFLLMNGHILLPSSDEMVSFAVEVASSHPALPWEDAAAWSNKTRSRWPETRGKRYGWFVRSSMTRMKSSSVSWNAGLKSPGLCYFRPDDR